MDFTKVFKKEENASKDEPKFLSKLFGLFSEKIPPIWCKTKYSQFEYVKGGGSGRPTIKKNEEKRGKTLDFVFKDKNADGVYIVEQKCWVEYQKFKHFAFSEKLVDLLKTYGGAMDYFLSLAKNPSDENFKVFIDGKETQIKGAILIWAKTDGDSIPESIQKDYPYLKVLSMEQMITDLVNEKNQEYFDLINQYKKWSDDFFDNLDNLDK